MLDEGAVLNARNGKGRTPLYESAKRGHSQVVQLLLERGADVDAREARGFTALMAAVRHGHIAELLLDGGADPNSRCGCGSTPLYHAVMVGDAALVRLLLDRGAEVNAKVHGQTPLQLAEDREARDLAQVLRDHGGKTFRDYHTGQTQ
ncbi:MAG: ankyrin repeat domain-containing protein [Nitrospirales bacterium]